MLSKGKQTVHGEKGTFLEYRKHLDFQHIRSDVIKIFLIHKGIIVMGESKLTTDVECVCTPM